MTLAILYSHQQTCNQPSQETLKNNLEKFRKEHVARLNEAGRHFVFDSLSEYEKQIAEKALAECKDSNEWRALGADDIRFKATGVMNAMGVEELLDRHPSGIQGRRLVVKTNPNLRQKIGRIE